MVYGICAMLGLANLDFKCMCQLRRFAMCNAALHTVLAHKPVPKAQLRWLQGYFRPLKKFVDHESMTDICAELSLNVPAIIGDIVYINSWLSQERIGRAILPLEAEVMLLRSRPKSGSRRLANTRGSLLAACQEKHPMLHNF